MKNTKGKHLTISDRTTIELYLKEDRTCLEISQEIDKDPSTISKEIKKHRVTTKANSYLDRDNFRSELPLCPRQERFPHVCNGCPSQLRNRCRKMKYRYKAGNAQVAYEESLVQSRVGINMTIEEIEVLDTLITPLIKNGQSLYHIKHSNSENILPSERTLYRYVENNILSAINLDLPRKVKYKPRRNRKANKAIQLAKHGHLRQDYLDYMSNNYIVDPVQFDVVEGLKTDEKCLLTIQFTTSKLMLIRLLKKQTALYVVNAFDNIESGLGCTELYYKLFECSLTDNGGEFSDVFGLEYNKISGEKRMNVFYCNPMRSDEKGALEKNHVHIRSILPKGTSFQNLTDDKVKKIETNINSYLRKSLNSKAPFDVFTFIHGASIASKLSIENVDSKKVILKPKLIL